MLKDIILKTYDFVKNKKRNFYIKLFSAVWLSIFVGVACTILFCGIPGVGICVGLFLSIRIKSYFKDAYRGKISEPSVIFFEIQQIKQPLIAILWSKLKIWIWILIPFVGAVFSMIKSYEYRFVPYILSENYDITPKEAVLRSSKETKGFKRALFSMDILFIVGFVFPCGLLFLFSQLPAVGFLFGVIMVIYIFFYIAFVSVARELVNAVFYMELQENNIKPYAKAVYCPFCMSKMDSNCMFCSNCGEKLK